MNMTYPAAGPAPGGRGHKRRSRWLTGKFLVLFLAVATLLGGAALVAPQFQEKASAIDDGRDITWDIGNGNAGASRYTSMIEAVRQRASGGRILHDRTYQTRTDANAINDYFSVDMTVQDQGTSTPSRIRLQVRTRDLFVVGWLNVNQRIYNRIESGTPPFGDYVGNPRNTPFNGSYLELERRAGDRASIPLSPNSARQAVRDLSRSGSSPAQEARGIIVLIQAISEAARFRPIEELFRNTYTTEAATPSATIRDLEVNWGSMSELAHRHVDNPNDEAINTLMRAHAGILGDLGITSPAAVTTALLGITLSTFLP